jgi:PAS domain S-box-containing protein
MLIQVSEQGPDLRLTQDAVGRALRASEASLREVFDLNPDATNVNRLQDGRYIAVNESFLQMMGWTGEEVLGRTSAELGIWDDLGERDRLVARLEAQGLVRDFEARFRTRSGQVFHGSPSVERLRGLTVEEAMAEPPAGHPGALRVRLHPGRHRAARRARLGPGIPAEAVHSGDAGGTGAGDARFH